MNITFKRDFNHSYMVVTGKMKPEPYEERMLQANDVPGVLPFHTGTLDGETQYWYDITGKRTLRDFFSQEKVTRENLTVVFRQLQQVCRGVEEYLIRQEHLLFTADGIYLAHSGDGEQIYLCYCPLQEKNIRNEFLTVTEHLISEVNHSDGELCKACYDLYEASLHEDFSFQTAYELVQKLEPKESIVAEYQDRCIQIHRVDEPEELPMEEDYEDEGEEEGESMLEILRGKFLEWKSHLFSGAVQKRKELFPLPSEEEDFVFDAEVVCEPRTQMLRNVKPQEVYKLSYEGRGAGADILLGEGSITIGSKAGENSVVIPSPLVSRYHARIKRLEDGSYQLEDLNSTNGTYCNGDLLSYHEPYILKPQDQILFADEPYRVR